MLSRRSNEIQNARKEQKYFWSIKNFSRKKKKNCIFNGDLN